MKHKHIIACLCYSLTCMASCQVENNELPLPTAELSMHIVAQIEGTAPVKSRYGGNSPTLATFQQKDSIGIFVDEEPVVRWEYNGELWTPEEKAYWPDKDSLHTFRAFYPYSKATSYTNIPMPNLKQQDGTMESLSRCDFLIATTQQKYGDNGVVNFNTDSTSFKHVSSLVQLKFMAIEDLTNATLNKITIVGYNITTPTTYSFINKVKPSTNQSDTLTISPNKSMTQGDGIFYLIVNEKKDTSAVTLSIEYSIGNQTYLAETTDFPYKTFTGGMQQNVQITIRNKTLSITGAGIIPWEGNEKFEDIIIDAKEK